MYQKLILIGNLGNDPEMRFTQSGVPVASFRMATSRQWNNAQGERQEKVNWWRVTVWNKQAETVTKYLHKGSKVMVEGEVEEASAYVNKAGDMAATVEVKAQTVKFMDSKRDDDDEGEQVASVATGRKPATKQIEDPESIPF